jgi:thioredoxin-related protein
MKDTKEKIEMLANIVFIAMVLLLGGIAIKNTMFSKNNNDVGPRVGSQLSNPPGYEWKTHDQTLVLVLMKNCQYCKNSMPFYRKLMELKQAGKISAHIISIFSDPLDEARDVMNREKIAVDVIGGALLSNYKVSGTPTLILIDKQGRVMKSWIGQLSEDVENEVVRTLSGSS